MSKEKYRLEWADVAKGICILSVIIGHMGYDVINRVVFLYHLPVFFLLAGYFMKKKPDKVVVYNKGRRLLIPYGFTCLMICVIASVKAILRRESVSTEFITWVQASLYAAGDNWEEPFQIKGIGAIWFLWALFFAIVIVNHFIDKRNGRIIIIIIAYMGWASFDRTQVWLPLSIQAGMLAALYVMIGYEAKVAGIFPDKIKAVTMTALLLVCSWEIWAFKGFWLVHDYMGNGWIDFFASICASVVIMIFSNWVCRHDILRICFAWCGRNSLQILCFHLIELNVISMNTVINRIGLSGLTNTRIYSVVLVFLKVFFPICMTVIINNTMIGRKVYMLQKSDQGETI